MNQEKIDELLIYCQSELGEALRVVTYYGVDDHKPIYTRSDVSESLQLDDETREMFRSPLIQMQRSAQHLAGIHPVMADPTGARYIFEDICLIQLPITTDEGIIITIDFGGQLPDEFESQCASILSEDEQPIV